MTTTTELADNAAMVLEEIGKTHDTTTLTVEQFAELCRATRFYLQGGHSPESVARLVIEEIWIA